MERIDRFTEAELAPSIWQAGDAVMLQGWQWDAVVRQDEGNTIVTDQWGWRLR